MTVDQSVIHDLTEISSLTVTDQPVTDYYSIDGNRLTRPHRGVNIIRMSDGTKRKVVIK